LRTPRSGRSSSLSTGTTPTRLRRIAVSLGVAELVNGAGVVDRCVDYLHGLAFEAIGNLLERERLRTSPQETELYNQVCD
jgi:hypothetical protein